MECSNRDTLFLGIALVGLSYVWSHDIVSLSYV
jgi:hypothetical protein